jgi:hypothetical protein
MRILALPQAPPQPLHHQELPQERNLAVESATGTHPALAILDAAGAMAPTRTYARSMMRWSNEIGRAANSKNFHYYES